MSREVEKQEIYKSLGLTKDEWGNLFNDKGEFTKSIGSDSKKLNYLIKTILELKNEIRNGKRD